MTVETIEWIMLGSFILLMMLLCIAPLFKKDKSCKPEEKKGKTRPGGKALMYETDSEAYIYFKKRCDALGINKDKKDER